MFIYNHVKNREYITLLHINRKNCIYYGMGPIHMPKTIGKTRLFTRSGCGLDMDVLVDGKACPMYSCTDISAQ